MNYVEYLKDSGLVKKKKSGLKIEDRLENDQKVFDAQKEHMAALEERLRKEL